MTTASIFQNGKRPVAPHDQPLESSTEKHLDFITPEQKRFANFQAAAALNGVQTWCTRDELRKVFIVSSHGRTRDFYDLDQAEQWLRVVSGGAKP